MARHFHEYLQPFDGKGYAWRPAARRTRVRKPLPPLGRPREYTARLRRPSCAELCSHPIVKPLLHKFESKILTVPRSTCKYDSDALDRAAGEGVRHSRGKAGRPCSDA